jgi:hypothetical protein
VNMKNRAQVWYALLADCNQMAHTQYPYMPAIKYELEMTNDGSHFSHEYWGQLPMTGLMLCLFTYYLASVALKFFKEISKNEDFESPLFLLVLAIFFEFMQLLLRFIHLCDYWDDGYGFWPIDYISTIFQIASQVTIVSLIIMIAYGWTITYENLKDSDTYIVVGGFVFVVHIILAFLTIVDNGEHHKYHDFEGFQGLLLVFLRLGLYGIFLYGVKETFKVIPRKTADFMKGFVISCSLYMVAFPALWVLSYILNPHMRLKFIVFGNFIIQGLAILILINQLAKKGSKYYEASMRSKGILPNKFQ